MNLTRDAFRRSIEKGNKSQRRTPSYDDSDVKQPQRQKGTNLTEPGALELITKKSVEDVEAKTHN